MIEEQELKPGFKEVEIEMVINGFNICFISGTIADMIQDKDHKGQDRLNFTLVHVNVAMDKRQFDMDVKVSFYGMAALNVAKRFKDGMYVIVEGKLRKNEDLNRYKISGVHVQSAEWIRQRIKVQIPVTPEEEEAGNDN